MNATEKPQDIFEDYNNENGILLNCITNTVSNNHYPQSHISQWIIDSGASIHITGCIDLQILKNVMKKLFSQTVRQLLPPLTVILPNISTIKNLY